MTGLTGPDPVAIGVVLGGGGGGGGLTAGTAHARGNVPAKLIGFEEIIFLGLFVAIGLAAPDMGDVTLWIEFGTREGVG